MGKELQHLLKGSSIKRRRGGLKAHQTRLLRSNNFLDNLRRQAEMAKRLCKKDEETHGGKVERLILRTPLKAEMGSPQVIDFHQAVFECSRYARVSSDDFENLNDMQVRFLMTLEDEFNVPSLEGVLAELFDKGCIVTNRINQWLDDTAEYKLHKTIVR